MCRHNQYEEKQDFASEKKYRLADFFNMWWDKYCENPNHYIRPEEYKAVNSIKVCRTEVLGVDYYSCPECGDISEVRHSCKNRFCPTCSWKDTIIWAEHIKAEMFNLPHRHVVFTLPHQLNGLLKKNRRQILNFLSRSAAETLKEWMKKKYGIKIGIISVIHTYGEKKNLHAHVHMIVSWGGIDLKTGKLRVLKGKKEEYVRYDFLKAKFRCKFEDELVDLFDSGQMLHDFNDRIDFMKFVKKINTKKWQIHFELPIDCPASVIRYIARYSKRACLSEYKIVNIDGEYITFRYKDYKDRDENKKPKEKLLCLHYRDFFPRLLQHVPEPYFRMVRYYGAYGSFKNIPQQYKSEPIEKNLSETIENEYQTSEKNPKYCAACTAAKIFVYRLLDTRPKRERIEPFDIEKHSHLIIQMHENKPEEQNLKNVA